MTGHLIDQDIIARQNWLYKLRVLSSQNIMHWSWRGHVNIWRLILLSISEQYKVLTCLERVNIAPPWHLSTAWICYSLLARAMHGNRIEREKEFIAGYDFSLVSPLNRNQCYLESRGVTEENTSTLPSKYIPILYSRWDERVNVLNIL